MTSRTTSTEWPSVHLSEHVKALLDRFLTLLDDPSDSAPARLASECFTPDAEFKSSLGIVKGSEAIVASRAKAWDMFKERYHAIVKVYSATSDGSDLLFLGRANLVLRKNGIPIESELVGRAVIEGVETMEPRLKFFQAWGDSGPTLRALELPAKSG